MNHGDIEGYRARLTTLLRRVEGTAARAEEQASSPLGGEAGGGISNAPLHLGDLGSESLSQEIAATLLDNETSLRDQIADALERIDSGRFGKCEECGQPIARERLDALPYTPDCVSCAESVETPGVNLNDGRPEEWLGNPGHQSNNETGTPQRVPGRNLGGVLNDTHAAGTPGGGTEVGGLAGTNVQGGEPYTANLEETMGGGERDAPAIENTIDAPEALSGSSRRRDRRHPGEQTIPGRPPRRFEIDLPQA